MGRHFQCIVQCRLGAYDALELLCPCKMVTVTGAEGRADSPRISLNLLAPCANQPGAELRGPAQISCIATVLWRAPGGLLPPPAARHESVGLAGHSNRFQKSTCASGGGRRRACGALPGQAKVLSAKQAVWRPGSARCTFDFHPGLHIRGLITPQPPFAKQEIQVQRQVCFATSECFSTSRQLILFICSASADPGLHWRHPPPAAAASGANPSCSSITAPCPSRLRLSTACTHGVAWRPSSWHSCASCGACTSPCGSPRRHHQAY